MGVIGTGSSAIQSIPVIAGQAAELTVFQRTPNYSVPAWNGAISTELYADRDANRDDYRASARGQAFAALTEPANAPRPRSRRPNKQPNSNGAGRSAGYSA